MNRRMLYLYLLVSCAVDTLLLLKQVEWDRLTHRKFVIEMLWASTSVEEKGRKPDWANRRWIAMAISVKIPAKTPGSCFVWWLRGQVFSLHPGVTGCRLPVTEALMRQMTCLGQLQSGMRTGAGWKGPFILKRDLSGPLHFQGSYGIKTISTS